MGGCCCCSYRRTQPHSAPSFYYVQRTSEERQPLASRQHGAPGLAVDTDLETSFPDTYRPPPAPLPYDADIRHPQPLSESREIHETKDDSVVQMTNADSKDGLVPDGTPISPEKGLKGIDGGITDLNLNPEDDLGSEELKKPCKSIDFVLEEEEGCPICLEEYDAENPKIVANCGHHFHLSCIFEWMERSDNCAVCDKEMILDEAIGS